MSRVERKWNHPTVWFLHIRRITGRGDRGLDPFENINSGLLVLVGTIYGLWRRRYPPPPQKNDFVTVLGWTLPALSHPRVWHWPYPLLFSLYTCTQRPSNYLKNLSFLFFFFFCWSKVEAFVSVYRAVCPDTRTCVYIQAKLCSYTKWDSVWAPTNSQWHDVDGLKRRRRWRRIE